MTELRVRSSVHASEVPRASDRRRDVKDELPRCRTAETRRRRDEVCSVLKPIVSCRCEVDEKRWEETMLEMQFLRQKSGAK